MSKRLPSSTKSLVRGFASTGGIRREAPELSPRLRFGWIRGKAFMEGQDVFLETGSQSIYCPEDDGNSVLWEFINLDLESPQQIIKFVSRFGLLSEDGICVAREPISEWKVCQNTVTPWIGVISSIQGAIRDEPGGLNQLADITKELYEIHREALHQGHNITLDGIRNSVRFAHDYEQGFYGSRSKLTFTSVQKTRLIEVGMDFLAYHLNEPLKRIDFGISCYPVKKEVGVSSPKQSMFLDHHAPDLYHYIILQVAFLAVDNISVRRCICGCGRFFPVTRKNRIYYSPACGGSKRGTASKKRRKAKGPVKSS